MTTQQMLQEIQEKIAHEYTDFFADGTSEHGYYPISLSRVLSALGGDKKNGHIETHQYFDGSFQIFTDHSNTHLCVWKTINDDNSDATLDDQSPETIKAIWEIVCK